MIYIPTSDEVVSNKLRAVVRATAYLKGSTFRPITSLGAAGTYDFTDATNNLFNITVWLYNTTAVFTLNSSLTATTLCTIKSLTITQVGVLLNRTWGTENTATGVSASTGDEKWTLILPQSECYAGACTATTQSARLMIV